jgi:hypothetical protein
MADFSVDDMRRFAAEAWGEIGARAVDMWCRYNGLYFGGVLKPIPIVLANTQPRGKRLAFCSCGAGRTITLNILIPKITYTGQRYARLADNCTLLHEMVHQALNERGEDASHTSEGWRREIMRLHKLMTGEELWAGRSITTRVKGKMVRINKPAEDGRPSLGQGEIARWPHDSGIRLGALGEGL